MMTYKGRELYLYENRVAVLTPTGRDMIFANVDSAKAYIDKQESKR